MKTIDKIDEILRFHVLETAKEIDDDAATLEMDYILSLGAGQVEINHSVKTQMLTALQQIILGTSFGKLLRSEMETLDETPGSIATKSMLPHNVIQQLMEDHIHTTNVPVVMMKDLLKLLRIPFEKAEQAIRITFLQLKSDIEQMGNSSVVTAPAFRKSGILSKATVDALPKGNGKDLYENEEVMEKYLKRLKELSA